MDTENVPKYSLIIGETQSGKYFIESLKVNADTIEEMESLLDSAMSMVTEKLLRLNKRKRSRGEPKIQASEKEMNKDDKQLFKELKELRLAIAKLEGIRAYKVFKDSTLRTISKIRPKTEEEMMQIAGVGPSKFENYGDVFLSAVRDYEFGSQIQ